VTNNFEVVGHLPLGGKAPDGDVYFFDHGGEVGPHAYVGTWIVPCTRRGVKIVDVNDPANPALVAIAAGRHGVSYEDMVVKRVGNRDILAVGLQSCARHAHGGLALYDVTNPNEPELLSFHRTPAHGVHELDLVVRPDGRALALLAVPYTELLERGKKNVGGEFLVVDVTNPERPRRVSQWGAIEDSSLPVPYGTKPVRHSAHGRGYFPFNYAHSVRAADEGSTAYVSYWDLGVLKFDISDPADPNLVGRTVYEFEADGDAHSMTTYEVDGTRYLLQNDEDYDAVTPVTVTTSATGDQQFPALEMYWMQNTLTATGRLTDEVVAAGDGCQRADYRDAVGKIALVDLTYSGKAPCGPRTQILRAAAADVEVLMQNVRQGGFRPFMYVPQNDFRKLRRRAGDLMVVAISNIDPLASAIRSASGVVMVTFEPNDPTWGFLRIYSESGSRDADGDGIAEFRQAGEFADLPHVREFPAPMQRRGFLLATHYGSWSVHNTEVWADRAYSSWYSHGIVALDLSDPTDPQLAGQWVPPSKNERRKPVLGRGPAMVWGVAIDPERGLIYASDMRTGLWIVRPTGPAATR
jgi:hypothetical protein